MANRIDFLVLEDDKIRIDWLFRSFPSATIAWASQYETFKEILECNPKCVILDHDLGVASKNGYDAAKLIPTLLTTDIPVIIWSNNPVGSANMVSYLKAQGYMAAHLPFSYSNSSLVISLINILKA